MTNILFKNEDEIKGQPIGPMFIDGKSSPEWVTLKLTKWIAERMGATLEEI